jgi:peptidyl-prolyl cis-trans isomerase B (cyclophilin B)
MKKIITLLLVLLLAGCAPDLSELPYYEYINEDNPEIIIDYNGTGKITIQLFPEVAPNTVNNFLELAQDGFYDGVLMHRVIEDFMIQGGDPEGNGTGNAGYTIQGEFSLTGYQNDLSHFRGVISMARSQVYDSASSQFFIVHKDADFLDGSYAAFGGIVDGFDTLDDIATTATTNDTPDTDIYIKGIEVNLNGYKMRETSVVKPLSADFFLPGEFRSEENPQVLITYADDQEILIELFPSEAPVTVDNFLRLVEEGFYDGLIMHRIIADFMIQGGDPDGDGTGGDGTLIKGEFKSNGIDNCLSHVRGVISMARSSEPNSASSQFFIVHKDSTFLDGSYAAFGAIVTGFETLDYYASVETNASDRPLEEVVIKSIERVR